MPSCHRMWINTKIFSYLTRHLVVLDVGVVQRPDCGVVELRILGTCSEASGND